MSDYDFIVVGSGAGGAVVANRLSETSASVLLLEAGGPDIPDNVRDPRIWFTLLGSDVDWKYSSTPQPGLNNRQAYEPRGKIPGGSSNFYIMMHIRGHRSDFDTWAYMGAPGWTYDECEPYFQKLEKKPSDPADKVGISVINAGQNGPNPTSAVFIEACKELGYPETDDFNGPNMEGTGWHHVNIKDGKRDGVNESYIEPYIGGRANWTMETNAQATRILFDGKKAVGVEYVQNGETKTANASKEVIVCAGALESPKLLMLSGIGPAAHLQEHGIEVLVDLPGVGENFHNHVLTGVVMECKQQVPMGNLNNSESALFLKSHPGYMGPDLQIAFVHVNFDIITGQDHPNAVSILPGVVRPMARGTIRLASNNPLDYPLVNPNYLGVAADLERMVQGVKLARQIFATDAFSAWVETELMPGPDVKTDDDIREFVKSRADSYHHQAGSCKMGTDAMAVLDPQCRVYGVEGLRVADASAMPVVPSGNCHAGIMMIAERVADWIKADHSL